MSPCNMLEKLTTCEVFHLCRWSTHTPALTERVRLNEGWPWRWRNDQPTPAKRTTGKEPETTKEGKQQQQQGGGGRKQEARGGGENSTKQHNKHNRERLSGDKVWDAFGVWWTTTHHTQTQEKEGDATRKRRTQTHPRPWQQPGPALKGKEKAESEHPGKPTHRSGDGGEGDEQTLESLKKAPKT